MDEVTAQRIATALEGIERHLADLAAAQGATGRAEWDRGPADPFKRARARRASVESTHDAR